MSPLDIGTPERWRRVKAVVAEVMDAAADERAALLDRACGDDVILRREVDALLSAARESEGIFDPNTAAESRSTPSRDGHGEHDPALRAALESGLAGRYVIERELGYGGMATVYLAQDTHNERRIAIKVLDPALVALLGRQRFLTEVRVTANLAHPNILPLFDSGEANGLLYYTMPYVTGETLRERLRRERQLPIEEAVRLTAAIAGALDYAHRQGIVHRDLKPENILLEEGQPLVMDFGIALAVSKAGGDRLTETGLSLGTPQYMSPEQAAGDRAIDGRSDVYALGVIAYEMLVGEPPHTGASAQAILARVLTEVPRPIRAARPKVPVHVAAAVERALEKLPADRFESAGRFGEAIQGRVAVNVDSPDVAVPASSAGTGARTSGRQRWPWTGAALALGGVLAGAAIVGDMLRPRLGPAPQTIRFSFPVTSIQCLAVSPDGMRIAYADGPRSQLYVRDLRDAASRTIDGAEGVAQAGCFFSPDGEWIGFLADGRLQKVNVATGSIVPILSMKAFGGASWGAKQVIVFGDATAGLSEVPAGGGVPHRFTRVDSVRGEVDQGNPAFFPDGETVAFTSAWGRGQFRIGIASLDGRVTLLRDGIEAQPVAGDGLLIAVDDKLVAAHLDIRRRALTTAPVEVVQNVAQFAVGGPAATLAYGTPSGGPLLMILLGRNGEQQRISSAPRWIRHPRVSPDGKRIVAEIDANGGVRGGKDVETFDIATQTWSRLTFDGNSSDPIWSPDGERVAYVGWGRTGVRPFWSRADGSGARQPLFRSNEGDYPTSFTPDGREVVLDEIPGGGDPVRIDLAQLGEYSPRVVLGAHDVSYRYAALSPDGHWLAYTTTATGRREVFVRRFPVADDGQFQISQAGGKAPVWSRDGRELYYRDGRKIMLAEVRTRPSFEVISRRALADDDFFDDTGVNYDAAPDGKLLLLKSVNAPATMQVNVVVNWLPELQRLLGEKK